ncbi:MAG: Flp pilus assembly complex ATPase component TadA [Candidatus Omnitrophica bacterium]|nr:Flp pilus assembly complex ATPase component TadA [Candidatus Omnitrophota bacterium]
MKHQEKIVKLSRRQYERVRAQLSLEYRIVSEDKSTRAWNSTVTKNISAVGLCLESFHPLGLNSNLEISLRVPFFQDPIMLKGRVVRAAEIKLGEIYGVAVAITDIKPEDRNKLQIELEQIDITCLLQQAVEQGATDLHLSLGHPPLMRKTDKLQAMEYDPLGKNAIKRMLFSLLTESEIEYFNKNFELNTAITLVTISGTYRFRVNVFFQQGIIEAVFHAIMIPVPKLKDLHLPKIMNALIREKSGLIILTGHGGSGKTTTCAAMIEEINSQQQKVITMLQQPIEYMFEPKQSIIRQRQITKDVHSYSKGLEEAAYQNSDIIVLDKIPDVQTLELVLATAQSGCLVILTIPSSSIIAALNQLIYVFPLDRQYYARKIISESLKAIIFQKLLNKKAQPETRIAGLEIFINNPESANVIKEGFFDKIPGLIQTGTVLGMRSMEQSMIQLFEQGLIDSSMVENADK